jgi:hypothetical protein
MTFKVTDLIIPVLPPGAAPVGTLQLCARASPMSPYARTYYGPVRAIYESSELRLHGIIACLLTRFVLYLAVRSAHPI